MLRSNATKQGGPCCIKSQESRQRHKRPTPSGYLRYPPRKRNCLAQGRVSCTVPTYPLDTISNDHIAGTRPLIVKREWQLAKASAVSGVRVFINTKSALSLCGTPDSDAMHVCPAALLLLVILLYSRPHTSVLCCCARVRREKTSAVNLQALGFRALLCCRSY